MQCCRICPQSYASSSINAFANITYETTNKRQTTMTKKLMSLTNLIKRYTSRKYSVSFLLIWLFIKWYGFTLQSLHRKREYIHFMAQFCMAFLCVGLFLWGIWSKIIPIAVCLLFVQCQLRMFWVSVCPEFHQSTCNMTFRCVDITQISVFAT